MDINIPEAAMPAWDRLAKVLETTQTPCQAMPDYWQTPEKATMRKAAQMCNSCPALQACARYARTAGEPSGVWGGTMPGRRAANR
ncbi:WhiB family transcriptional regulator [Spelaeicoccus albus]|uniref:4Fe-4S Wbl-type domain-containing protein n=1 Tax=Spelaeicoccus albus TaxID=1280376 RepID=A0A7Z0A900_9MICO|nr:WhiB family transcriptional regulator [Spelaeicoccus albus]NYI66527.1 hypothetical protein [Spelaeicoccus albus]